MSSQPTEVFLVPIEREEWPALRDLAGAIWPDAYGRLITPAQIRYMLDQMYSDAAFSTDLEKGISYRWIEIGGAKAGFLAFGPTEADRPCFLHKCYVDTKRQGSGIGSLALTALISELRISLVQSLELRVNRENKSAIGFYQKNGFRITGEDCLEIGHGFVMDDYLMSLEL